MRSKSSIAVGLISVISSGLTLSAQTQKVPALHTRPAHVAQAPPQHPIPPKAPEAETVTLPAGLPLRVQLDHRYRLRTGEKIRGRLIDPVYSGDHVVLLKGTIVYGTIFKLVPVRGSEKTWALLDGDLTPLKKSALRFTSMRLPDGRQIPFMADAAERTAPVVKMSPPPRKQSLVDKAKAQIEAKKDSIKGITDAKHKSDVALRFIYGQLPYHPQDIWAGTQFDAVLDRPLKLRELHPPKPLPIDPPKGHLPPGTLQARLVTPLTSATDKVGDPVKAVLTQPYLDASGKEVVLPTGTRLIGKVTQARPARKLGRNGTLRFTFRQVELPDGVLQAMHGQMTAVEGRQGQNVTLDSEGGAKANSGQGKFLAPILLGALAGHSFDADQGAAEAGVYSNGFGIVARVISFVAVTPAVSAGFAFYGAGKSMTRRWLMPGHNIVFAKNTRMQLAVADR